MVAGFWSRTLRRFHQHPSPLYVPCRSFAFAPHLGLFSSFSTDGGQARHDDGKIDYRARIQSQKYDVLMDALNRDNSNPSRAWSAYRDLLEFMGLEPLPVELHQSVLRKCVPPARQLRLAAARRLHTGRAPRTPHMYENRLKVVIRNIRDAGHKPSKEDYQFILQQFAAVGHYEGVVQIVQEMRALGIEIHQRTYGLCLQAIAHRLRLPCSEEDRPYLLEGCSRMTSRLIKDMVDHQVPYTSINLDLAIRILKDTENHEGFDRILKSGYGVDLEYPDRFPLEYHQRKEALEGDNNTIMQPLSTGVLNTIVDFLGRTSSLAKMIQTFEVLTAPLPDVTQISSETSFDDDEDDLSYITSDRLPSAPPNITTYNMLIKYACRKQHTIVARHYLLDVIHLDRLIAERLQAELLSKSMDEVARPRLSVNAGTMLPLLGVANRDGDFGLLRWLIRRLRDVQKAKKRDRAFLQQSFPEHFHLGEDSNLTSVSGSSEDLPEIESNGLEAPESERPHALEDERMTAALRAVHNNHARLKEPEASAQPSLKKPGLHGTDGIHSPPLDMEPSQTEKEDLHPLDLDLDEPPAPTISHPRKFNIYLHVAILERDLKEIAELESRINHALLRISTRTKEKLGRRVTAGKNVYVSSVKKRTVLSKDHWMRIAQFRASTESAVPQSRPPRGPTDPSKRVLSPAVWRQRKPKATAEP